MGGVDAEKRNGGRDEKVMGVQRAMSRSMMGRKGNEIDASD